MMTTVKQSRAEYMKLWAAANPEKVAEKNKRWRENNPGYYAANADRYAAATKKHRATARYADRKSSPGFQLASRVRSGMLRSLGGGKCGNSWSLLVGYDVDALRDHIERQFTKGMSWENMGEWHIDHIIPLSSFTIAGPDDPELRRAWSLTNLRPLWAKDNLKKGAKRQFLL